MVMRRRRNGDYDATVFGRGWRTAVAGGSAGAKTKRRRSWRRRLQHSCGGQQGGRAAAGGNGRRDGNVTATAMDGATAMRWQRDGDCNAMATGWRRRTAVAGSSAGAKTKMATTEAAVEATAIPGGVDTLAAMTAMTATIVVTPQP